MFRRKKDAEELSCGFEVEETAFHTDKTDNAVSVKSRFLTKVECRKVVYQTYFLHGLFSCVSNSSAVLFITELYALFPPHKERPIT